MIIEHPVLMGVRKSARITVTQAATDTLLYQVPTGRTIAIRKIWARNYNVADTDLTFWTDTVNPPSNAVQQTPGVTITSGFNGNLSERDIPRTELSGYVYVQASQAAASPNDLDLLVEWDEFAAGGVPSS